MITHPDHMWITQAIQECLNSKTSQCDSSHQQTKNNNQMIILEAQEKYLTNSICNANLKNLLKKLYTKKYPRLIKAIYDNLRVNIILSCEINKSLYY